MNTKNTFFIIAIMFLFVQLSMSKENNGIRISKSVNSLNVSIDGREELISIIQYLGGYFRLNKFELDYKESVDEYFNAFREHEAVEFVQKLTKQGFSYDAPAAAILYFSDEYELDKELSKYLIKRIGGEANAKEFARLIKAFVNDTKFNKFLISQNEFYEQIVNDFSKGLSNFNEIETIENFFGKKQNSYNIILSVLNSGNYGPSITDGDKTDIYNIMSAKGIKEGRPTFGKIDDILYLVWHEFGHSFVNCLTEENFDLVMKYSNLQEPIKEQMKNQAYGNWPTIVNEHVIRAVTVKLAEAKYGSDIAANIKQKEIGGSFCYITPICNQLEIYIQNRDKYKTFFEFYPTLIKSTFDEALKTNYTDIYLKNLNSTYSEIDFIVISEDEGEKNIQKEVYSYVESVKNKLFKNIPLITDIEALNRDLSQYSFIVYGTVRNNLLIQKFKDELPIVVSDTYIYADKQYNTNDGKAIFNLSNPLNPKKTIVVYTAQIPSGIIGINNVFHGGTNYIVFENREKIYKAGFVEKENNKWICK